MHYRLAVARRIRCMQLSFLYSQKLLDKLSRVHGCYAGKVCDLVTARESGCDRDGTGRAVSTRGKQFSFSNLSRYLEVLGAVPKQPRHAAAARVGICNACA